MFLCKHSYITLLSVFDFLQREVSKYEPALGCTFIFDDLNSIFIGEKTYHMKSISNVILKKLDPRTIICIGAVLNIFFFVNTFALNLTKST